jgi:hypothetical protein
VRDAPVVRGVRGRAHGPRTLSGSGRKVERHGRRRHNPDFLHDLIRQYLPNHFRLLKFKRRQQEVTPSR